MTTKPKNSQNKLSDLPTFKPSNDLLRVEYVPLSTVKLWDRNPKKHDLNQIIQSIYRYGFQDPAKFDGTLGGLVFGNGRTEALTLAKSQGKQPPKGVMLDAETGEWGVAWKSPPRIAP